MTMTEGRRVKAGLADVNARLAALATDHGTRDRQIAEIDRALADANKVLTAGEDDAAAREAKTEAELAAVGARMDQLAERVAGRDQRRAAAGQGFDQRVARLEQNDARLVDRLALDLPDDKEQLWRQATALLAGGEGENGRRYARAFAERFPQDPRAADAYLSIGLSYAAESRFANAAATYQRLLAIYPTAPVVPEAMWQLSRAFVQMSFCSDAKTLLRTLIARYPRSQAAVAATKALNGLRHPPPICVG